MSSVSVELGLTGITSQLGLDSDSTQVTSTSTWALLRMGLDSTCNPHNELGFYLVRCLSVNCWNTYSSLDPVLWSFELAVFSPVFSPALQGQKTGQDRTLHHYESLSKMIDLDGKIVFGSGKCSVNIDKDCFLPRDALNDERPDTSDESGYTGNVSLSVQ